MDGLVRSKGGVGGGMGRVLECLERLIGGVG